MTSVESDQACAILVVAVAHDTPVRATTLAESFLADTGAADVSLVIADNSTAPTAALAALARQRAHDGLRYVHFPHNPGFSGAGRHVLSMLVAEHAGSLPYDAIVLCNVDLTFECTELRAIVADARQRTGDTTWILAPDIVEDGKAFRVNPQSMRRPRKFNGRFRHTLRRHSMRFDTLYRSLWRRRRRLRANPNADLPAFTRIYSAGGAFIVFGAGFFRSGGVFHDGPLFGEEYGFAEQASHLGVPVFYTPAMVVHHESEVSTTVERHGRRQRYLWHLRADAFYRAWRPEYAVGSMTAWFAEAGPSDASVAGVAGVAGDDSVLSPSAGV